LWDLNQAERRALRSAVCLVGLGLVGRTVLAPGVGDLQWQDASGDGQSRSALVAEVRDALLLEERAQTPLAPGEQIEVNRAPVAELRRLPGVGPGLAAEIVRERERGPLTDARDLERVAGIGEVTARRLAPHLTFGPSRPVAIATGATSSSPACDASGERIDLNRATSSDLERLPGIGPAIAARVLERRGAIGTFETVDALLDVRGIGPRLLERLRGLVCAGTS